MCFRNAKSLSECKDCLLKSSDCHRQNRALFHAAKALDQAVLVCKDLNDFNSIRGLAEKAANLHQQHGSPESAASSLDKAAKILESNYPEQALSLFQHALDVSMVSSVALRKVAQIKAQSFRSKTRDVQHQSTLQKSQEF